MQFEVVVFVNMYKITLDNDCLIINMLMFLKTAIIKMNHMILIR